LITQVRRAVTGGSALNGIFDIPSQDKTETGYLGTTTGRNAMVHTGFFVNHANPIDWGQHATNPQFLQAIRDANAPHFIGQWFGESRHEPKWHGASYIDLSQWFDIDQNLDAAREQANVESTDTVGAGELERVVKTEGCSIREQILDELNLPSDVVGPVIEEPQLEEVVIEEEEAVEEAVEVEEEVVTPQPPPQDEVVEAVEEAPPPPIEGPQSRFQDRVESPNNRRQRAANTDTAANVAAVAGGLLLAAGTASAATDETAPAKQNSGAKSAPAGKKGVSFKTVALVGLGVALGAWAAYVKLNGNTQTLAR